MYSFSFMKRYGKRPKVHAKQKGFKNFFMPEPMVHGKDTLMSEEMEEFIIDTIIIAKVKNEGERHADYKMAKAINKKLDEHFGGS